MYDYLAAQLECHISLLYLRDDLAIVVGYQLTICFYVTRLPYSWRMEGLAKKPPSRIRYEETHPVISVRLGMDDYRKLKEMKEERGISWAQLLREMLIGNLRCYREGFERGYQRGFEDGLKEGKARAYAEILLILASC